MNTFIPSLNLCIKLQSMSNNSVICLTNSLIFQNKVKDFFQEYYKLYPRNFCLIDNTSAQKTFTLEFLETLENEFVLKIYKPSDYLAIQLLANEFAAWIDNQLNINTDYAATDFEHSFKTNMPNEAKDVIIKIIKCKWPDAVVKALENDIFIFKNKEAANTNKDVVYVIMDKNEITLVFDQKDDFSENIIDDIEFYSRMEN